MAMVTLTNVEVLDNPTNFLNPFQFEITFECVGELKGGEFIFIRFWKSWRKEIEEKKWKMKNEKKKKNGGFVTEKKLL